MKKLPIIATVCFWPLLALAEEGQWEPSKLKASTLETAHRQTANYQHCIDTEGQGISSRQADARELANEVLQKCEAQLTPLREAFLSEGVSAQEADRYLSKTRTYAARNLLRALMEVQAMRGAADPAK
ncbi:MAG TPA: hypothetical protein VI457_03530 [Methylococcaceae bacterium]|nr:hypothetical protein [Methylococcaceae bacterium]